MNPGFHKTLGRDQEFGSQKGEHDIRFADSANKDLFVRIVMPDKYISYSWYLEETEGAIPGTCLQKQCWHRACVGTLSWAEEVPSQ